MIAGLVYNADYEGLLGASIDWVAGGNFDGYIHKTILRFYEDGRVLRTFKIIDQSRYDGLIENSDRMGSFRATDTGTFTCSFDTYSMRGRILGDKNQYLAFSIFEHGLTECYELKMS